MKKVYIAGPMRGIPEFNFPAFFEAQKKYEKDGYVVFNPADKDVKSHGEDIFKSATGDQGDVEARGFSLRDALAWDTARICESDGIVMLKGWENSKGARAEWALANALDLEIIYV